MADMLSSVCPLDCPDTCSLSAIVDDGKLLKVRGSAVNPLTRGGIFVSCGATTGADAVTDLARLFWSQLTLVGSTMGDMEEFRQVVSLFRGGALKPVIDGIFDAKETARAYERLESGEQFGKVAIRWA